MCLYLFNKAHKGTTTSEFQISKNIMVKLHSYINVTARGAKQINGVKLDGNAM